MTGICVAHILGHAFGQIAHHGGKAAKILPIHEIRNVVARGVRPGPILCKGDIANPHVEELGRQSLALCGATINSESGPLPLRKEDGGSR
jgi:hypothetical protein